MTGLQSSPADPNVDNASIIAKMKATSGEPKAAPESTPSPPVPPPTPAPGPLPDELAPPPSENITDMPVETEAGDIVKASGFFEHWLDKKPVKEPEKPKEEPGPEKPAPTEASKPKAKKKSPAQEVSVQQMTEVATTAAVKAAADVARSFQPAAKPEPEAPQPPTIDAIAKDLPDEYREDIPVIAEMERLNPAKYAGLVNKVVKAVKAEEDYVTKWQADHQGEEFDPEAEDHADFYARNFPNYSQADFKTAERTMIKREAREETMQAIAPKLEEMEAQKRVQQAAQAVDNTVTAVFTELVGAVRPEWTEHVKNVTKLNELSAEDPMAGDILTDAAGRWLPLANEAAVFYEANTVHNPQARKALNQFYSDLERAIAALPVDQQMDKGRRFATIQEFAALTPDQRVGRWYADQGVLLQAIGQMAAQDAKETYDATVKKMERYSQKVASKAPTATKPLPTPSDKTGAAALQAVARKEPASPAAPSGAIGIGNPTKDGQASGSGGINSFWRGLGVR